jgi:hypothetical protein
METQRIRMCKNCFTTLRIQEIVKINNKFYIIDPLIYTCSDCYYRCFLLNNEIIYNPSI